MFYEIEIVQKFTHSQGAARYSFNGFSFDTASYEGKKYMGIKHAKDIFKEIATGDLKDYGLNFVGEVSLRLLKIDEESDTVIQEKTFKAQ